MFLPLFFTIHTHTHTISHTPLRSSLVFHLTHTHTISHTHPSQVQTSTTGYSRFLTNKEWSASCGNAFDCDVQFNYTNAGNDMLNVTNVQWQAMLMDQAMTFGPDDGV